MLVLVSFGLVLLATILLVVGLLNDGLALIYISIAASLVAAVVLGLAFYLARPKNEATASGPAPLPDDVPSPADVTAAMPVVDAAPAPAPAAPAPAAAAAPAPPPPPAPEPAPVAAAAPSGDTDEWAEEEEWDDAFDFPIADYDDLRVDEIMPLLPQLYSDELELVAERERAGKGRSTILKKLSELAETGTEADAAELADAGDVAVDAAPEEDASWAEETVAEDDWDDDETWDGEPDEPEAAPVADVDEDPLGLGDEDDEYFFPIADYDELSVSQIMPLLSQLELDELEDVREREVAGAARKTLITEIDRYLSGELEAFSWDDADESEASAETVEETEADWSEPEPEPEPVDIAGLPIPFYAELTVADILPALGDLNGAQLEQVLAYEQDHDGRKTVIGDIENRLEAMAPPPPRRAPRKAAKRAPTRKASPKKSAARKAATKKSATRKSATKQSATKKSATKKATRKSAKKATKRRSTRFPIANYDDLTVADIRPRLPDLSENQLRQVLEREEAGAGRKTIIGDIENRLG